MRTTLASAANTSKLRCLRRHQEVALPSFLCLNSHFRTDFRQKTNTVACLISEHPPRISFCLSLSDPRFLTPDVLHITRQQSFHLKLRQIGIYLYFQTRTLSVKNIISYTNTTTQHAYLNSLITSSLFTDSIFSYNKKI